MATYPQSQFVGIDLHRRRSVFVHLDGQGQQLEVAHLVNDPDAWLAQLGHAGPDPQVVLEATYGWYWAADLLAAHGATVHLAHPLGVAAYSHRRVKNDVLDARELAHLLRTDLLPEAWIAPPATRQLRELVRYRVKLVHFQTSLKDQVHAVLAKAGIPVTASDLFGVAGRAMLADCRLPGAYRDRVDSLLGLLEQVQVQEAAFAASIARWLREDPGYRAVQAIPGVGPTLAAVFVAEIGQVHRFAHPQQLCSWAGLTPRHYESDTKVRRGHVTKQGSRLVRWAAVEAIQHGGTARMRAQRAGIQARRGKNIAKVAMARKLLTLVYYGLRDGHIRALGGAA